MIGLLCSDQFRRQIVCPILYKLMNDSCRWVYRAAAESLGLFISSFAKPCILGVAYRPNGELYIPNAADADYKYVESNRCRASLNQLTIDFLTGNIPKARS